MDPSLSISLEQVDTINRSLEKVMAIVQVMTFCSSEKRPEQNLPETGSIFMVMQMVVKNWKRSLRG